MIQEKPSAHLTWKELACRDGTPYPIKFIQDGRCSNLCYAFECIRHLFNDEPIIVLSAYRTPTHNAKVGGAKASQHVQGRALDLKPPKDITVEQFFQKIRWNARYYGIHGIGKYSTFVHIDIRPVNGIILWAGPGAKI